MRVLLLADIHANWAALQAINEPYDLCLFLGDLVDYGLEPTPCIDWVRKNAPLSVRGNHDHGAAQNVTVNGQSGFRWLTGITRPLTRQMLSESERRFLMDLPLSRVVTIDRLRFLLVHGTPRDPLDEYATADAEGWGRLLENIDADVICVGHTHIPFVLEVGNKLVVNPGSVGLPRDGNPKASYAVMEGRKVELKRIDYPIETTVGVIQASPLPDAAKELLIEVYRTGEARHAKPAAVTTRKPATPTPLLKPKPSQPGARPNVTKPKPASHGPVALPKGDGASASPEGVPSAAPKAAAAESARGDSKPLPAPAAPPARGEKPSP